MTKCRVAHLLAMLRRRCRQFGATAACAPCAPQWGPPEDKLYRNVTMHAMRAASCARTALCHVSLFFDIGCEAPNQGQPPLGRLFAAARFCHSVCVYMLLLTVFAQISQWRRRVNDALQKMKRPVGYMRGCGCYDGMQLCRPHVSCRAPTTMLRELFVYIWGSSCGIASHRVQRHAVGTSCQSLPKQANVFATWLPYFVLRSRACLVPGNMSS